MSYFDGYYEENTDMPPVDDENDPSTSGQRKKRSLR